MGCMGVLRHIGIVGVSPEGAALFVRRLSRLAATAPGLGGHPRISMHNEPLSHYIEAIRADDWHRVADLLRRSAEFLAACGAEVCLTPDNAVQYAIHLAEHDSKVPWLSMPDLVADALAADGRTRVGLMGTRWVTRGSAFQTMLGLRGIQVLSPDDADVDRLDDIILDELIYGKVLHASEQEVLRIANRLREMGCEAIIVGSSEVPLVLSEDNSPLPLYDSAEILARRALALGL